MPTRKDKTNVASIHREQVFIPASGTTLLKQQARPKVAGRPVSSGAIEIVSPEFDLLTSVRGIANLPKGFLKTNKLPQGENLYYRQLDKSSKGLERAKQVGVIDTKSSGGANFTTSRGTTLRIGKTFDTPFFAKGSLWYNNVDDMDVIVGKDNPLLDWKMITQHGRVTENAIKAANRRTPFYNGATNQAPTELFELYRRYPGIGYRNVTYGFPTIPITGLNTAAEQMKCGGRRKAQLGLDIREGGTAIPIAPNMYYMDGRSHDNGGIAIGPNNKNGLEVEGGEVVKVGNNDIKVFSSVPLLRGVSPAQLVLGGANPNKVFKAQEEFKDRNRINDDGTTYEIGGNKIIDLKNVPSSFRGKYNNGKYVQYGIPPAVNKAKFWNTKFKDHLNSLNTEVKTFATELADYGKSLLPKPLKKYYAKSINALYNGAKVEQLNSTANQLGQISGILDEYKMGGLSRSKDYGSKKKPYPSINKSDFAGGHRSYPIPTKADAIDALRLAGLHGRSDVKAKVYRKYPELRKKKEFGGNMIYTINGNVRNGLSLRPKAKMGKEEKIDDKTKIGEDGLVYKRGTDGNWYTDGTVHASRRKITSNKNIKQHSSKSSTPNTLEKVNFTSPLIQAERKKIGNLYYEQTEDGQWKPTANQSSVTTRNSGKPADFGMTRVGVNHPNGKYTYHPLTGEKINAYGTIETEEPSVKSVTKVSNKKSTSSTPRRGTSKSAVIAATTKSKTEPAYINYKPNKVNLAVEADNPTSRTLTKIDTSSTGDGTQSKDGNWVPQYNLITSRDWLGVGTNLAGHIASYFVNQDILDKYPMPIKPVMTPAVKLKTRVNINPELTNSKEAELMAIEGTNRNTSSSNTALARNQRIMNESRDARNKIYAYKENAETQLINQDRLNRQGIYAKNVAAYNDWLNKTFVAKTNKLLGKQQNLMSLINGIPMAVNNVLGNIETRKSTNDMIRAIAASNPNVDGRLFGIGDYYTQQLTNGKIAKYNKNHKFIKYV